MNDQLLNALKFVDHRATLDDIAQACKRLFVHSDEYHCTRMPFSEYEVDAVGRALSQFISEPHSRVFREIEFEKERPVVGKLIDSNEYIKMFSDSLLLQNYSVMFESLSDADLRSALKAFLVAIILRYAYCVGSDKAAFPLSTLMVFADKLRILLVREQKENTLLYAMASVVRALASLDP